MPNSAKKPYLFLCLLIILFYCTKKWFTLSNICCFFDKMLMLLIVCSEIGTAKVTITTFGLLSKTTSRILKEALNNQAFQVVIVDESHSIRNVKTVSAKTVVPLIKNANRRILLSGTPALARPVEVSNVNLS